MPGCLPEIPIKPAKKIDTVVAPGPTQVIGDFSESLDRRRQRRDYTECSDWFHGRTVSPKGMKINLTDEYREVRVPRADKYGHPQDANFDNSGKKYKYEPDVRFECDRYGHVNVWNSPRETGQNISAQLTTQDGNVFFLHVLPEGFQRIRYYGFLANRYREREPGALSRASEHAGAGTAGPRAHNIPPIERQAWDHGIER